MYSPWCNDESFKAGIVFVQRGKYSDGNPAIPRTTVRQLTACLRDEQRRIRRAFATRRWIIGLLDSRCRHGVILSRPASCSSARMR